MTINKKKFAVILLAHGTKEPEASQPVFQYANYLATKSNLRVEPCLREFIEPGVATVVGKLAKEGYEEIYVLPFFLFNSGHVVRDIHEDIAAERPKYPNLQFYIGNPLGFDEMLGDLLKKRLDQMLGR